MIEAITFEEAINICCHKCAKGKTIKGGFLNFPVSSQVQIRCSKCGNKRCPHATSHDLECTESNEAGQSGSVYQ